MRKFMTVLIGAASLAALLAITACKQFLADMDEELGYWASEPVITGFRAASPAQTSPAGVQCVPSASDAVITLTVRNPKNFLFVMPGDAGAPPDIVSFGSNIHDSSGTNPPAANADYTLSQSAHDTLTLTYKPAFLKRYEHSRANIGTSITLYSMDGRKFNQTYSFDLEANTPPQLEYVTIGKTAGADVQGKYYYVIILKAEDMTETAATASELLHEDIKTLSVTGGDSADIAFTPGNTGFFVDTGVPVADRRLLAANEVVPLASDEGPTPPSDWSTLNSDPWALRYKTNIVVKAASKTYTFRLTDKKGLSSSPVSASTSKTKAQDAQLFDGTTEISGTGELSPYSMNAELSAASVSVTARTTTAGAKITGMLEKPNDSSWVPRTIDSGSWSSIDIPLTAPAADQEALYKITVAAGGDGFVPGTEKVFYVKVTKSSTVTINSGEGAWMALKDAVENGTAHTVIVDGTITAPGADKQIQVNRTVKIMGKTGKTHDILDADDRTFIFDIWPDGNLTLEKLTLQKGNNTTASGVAGGGAIYCIGGKLKTDDVIIKECTAKNGGGIYAKYVASAPEIKLTNTQIEKCIVKENGGGVYVTGSGTIFKMTGGAVNGCKTDYSGSQYGCGGGIYSASSGSFLIIEGNTEISGNESTCQGRGSGGGIYVGNKSHLTVSGTVTIKGNKAKGYGGGVYSHGIFIFTGGTIEGNQITNPLSKMGTGIFSENSGETLEMSGNAYVANDNDIHLSDNSVVKITGALSNNPVARITPETYGTTTQVLLAGTGVTLANETYKFAVTPQIVSGTPQPWTVGGNGCLKQGRYTEVPYDRLEAYLANASATEVNYIEVTGIPVGDFSKVLSVALPPDSGELGERLKKDPSKEVALKLPSGLSVTNMDCCFAGCTNLVSLENFPSGVTSMQACFYGCEKLTTVPDIPATVTNMKFCFRYCKELTTALNIPAGVYDMTSCFQNCKKLQSVRMHCPYIGGNFNGAFSGCALPDGGIKVPSAQLGTYQTNANSMGTTPAKFSAIP